jgi:hypothetical protein
MNRGSSRFRPCLEALEERSLLSVSVTQDPSGGLTIDARQSNAPEHIDVFNNGNGHVTGSVAAGHAGQTFDFSNVTSFGVFGGPGGVSISYSQMGDPLNPSGNQIYQDPGGNPFGFSFALFAFFEGNNNSLTASFTGHALSQSVLVYVTGGSGQDAVSVNATGVDIGAFADFRVFVSGQLSGEAGGALNFNMAYSGTNRGALHVDGQAGQYAQATLQLDATFLGTASTSTSRLAPGRLFGPHGASAGDLALYGGTGDTNMDMLLFSPGGLPLTGDVYSGWDVYRMTGENSCFRTANVKSHDCQPDTVFGVRIPRLVRLPPFLPALALHP